MQYRSGLTHQIVEDFTSNYQSLKSSKELSQPFVYVSSDGEMKLITDYLEAGSEDSIFAVTVAEDGWMEYLAFHES